MSDPLCTVCGNPTGRPGYVRTCLRCRPAAKSSGKRCGMPDAADRWSPSQRDVPSGYSVRAKRKP